MEKLIIHPGKMRLDELRAIFQQGPQMMLDESARDAIQRSADTVQQVLDSKQQVYGINTGFGLLANTRIDDKELLNLQRNIVLSHAAGVGEALDDATVRLIMALKINSLARGYSGVRWEVIERLLILYNHEIYPEIPCQGSVGASGDLAPLAHMALLLIGEGRARYRGNWLVASEALALANLTPLQLGPKEGLALLNGTQVSTALALKGLFGAEDLLASALVTGAMSVEAAQGNTMPFSAEIHEVRGQRGQIEVAAAFRRLFAGESAINAAHHNRFRIQDPYCLRCQPQVMGACLDQIRHSSEILEREANAVSDNPLVFSDSGAILSGGNFHAEPVAMVADNLALAISEIGAIAERRIALLVDPHLSSLPAFLVQNSGVHSGFMIAQVTAAALASENKSLAHPACVDSLPTSANQEDHVSMATHGARRLQQMVDNSLHIIAIEYLAAAQGMDLRALPSTPVLEAAKQKLRIKVPTYLCDRLFATDIQCSLALLRQGVLMVSEVRELLPCVKSRSSRLVSRVRLQDEPSA